MLLGAAASAALVGWNSWGTVPKWWVWDVQLGSSLLVLAAMTLLACQLAAGRVSRDGATALYESYPMSATRRAAAHLIGLAGPLLLAVVVEGAAVAWLDFLGPVGSPRLGVLAQGLLLVALGGALGTALGGALPNPAAGGLHHRGARCHRVGPAGPVRRPGGGAARHGLVLPLDPARPLRLPARADRHHPAGRAPGLAGRADRGGGLRGAVPGQLAEGLVGGLARARVPPRWRWPPASRSRAGAAGRSAIRPRPA